jgi:hypothetical protein
MNLTESLTRDPVACEVHRDKRMHLSLAGKWETLCGKRVHHHCPHLPIDVLVPGADANYPVCEKCYRRSRLKGGVGL